MCKYAWYSHDFNPDFNSFELALLKSQRYVLCYYHKNYAFDYPFTCIAVSTPSNNTTLIIVAVIVATAILVLAMAAVVTVRLVLRRRRFMVSLRKGNM